MPRRPLHPALFILFYVLSLSLFFPATQLTWAQPYATAIFGAGIYGSFLLHVPWIYQAMLFVSRVTGERRRLRQALAFLFVCLVLAGYVALHEPVLKAHLSGADAKGLFGQESPLIPFGFAFSFMAASWITARAVCEAEAGGRVPAHSVVGTFLLFLYLAIGAPFLYRRLKALLPTELAAGT